VPQHVTNPMHIAAGGYCGEDRRGQAVFHPLPSLSIGSVMVGPRVFASQHEVSTALGEAKKQAKRLPGSVLFIERRRPSGDASCGDDAHHGAVSPAPTLVTANPPCIV